MNRSLVLLVGMAGMLPLAVENPGGPDSTSASGAETRIRVAGGTGYYAFIARGCEGQVIDELPVHFRDASVSVDHHVGTTPFRIGARGGWIRDKIDTSTSSVFGGLPAGRTLHNRYVNPYFVIDPGPSSFGFGYVLHENEFLTAGEGARAEEDHPLNDVSFHIRIGREDRKYFVVRWMESEPLYSGGGYLTIGMGGPTHHRSPLHLYGGLASGGPYEGAGLTMSGRYALGAGTRVSLTGRAGISGNSGANGAAVGLEMTIPPSGP